MIFQRCSYFNLFCFDIKWNYLNYNHNKVLQGMARHNTTLMAIVLFNMLFLMNCRVGFGNEGTVPEIWYDIDLLWNLLHAVFIFFFFKVPEQNCIELLSLRLSISQLHKDIDKTDSRSPNIKSSFKFGSIKSPVQHSFSFKHLLHPKCVEQSGCSRSLSKIPYSSTQTLASIHKHKLCWTCLCHPLSTLTISNNLMSRCLMC